MLWITEIARGLSAWRQWILRLWGMRSRSVADGFQYLYLHMKAAFSSNMLLTNYQMTLCYYSYNCDNSWNGLITRERRIIIYSDSFPLLGLETVSTRIRIWNSKTLLRTAACMLKTVYIYMTWKKSICKTNYTGNMPFIL